VVCTGAQGEKNAALMRIASREHRFLSINAGDTVIFSSSVIPGNERTVQSLKDTLVRQGAKIVHNVMMDVHAGGHAKQEDLKLMLRLTKPQYFMPIHGNRFMLEAHAELAESVGIPRTNIFVADNGQAIEFDKDGGRLTAEYVPTEYVMVDGLGVGDVSEVVLRDRRELAEDGMVVVICAIDKKTGSPVGEPDIITRGFVQMKESNELIVKMKDFVKKITRDADPRSPAFDDHIKNKIRNELGAYVFKSTERRPMILPVLIDV
jgi:ribonuclease J